MRVLLWILAVPVILLVLAAVLVPIFLDEEALVKLAAEKVREQSGVELRVDGEASLSLFPKVALSATRVTLVIPESDTTMEAESLSAGVALWPLLRRSVEIDSILVDGLTLTSVAPDEQAARVAKLDTGTLSNAELDAFYAARETARKTAQAEAAASVLAAPLALEVGELSLRDVRVVSVDRSGTVISELVLKQLTASDLNLDGRAVPLSAELSIPGEPGEEPIEIILAGEFTTDLNAERLTLGSLDLRVSGATPDPIALILSGDVALDTQIADLTLQLETGDLTGRGSLRYASFESPQINADLSLSELNPALLVLAGPEAASEATTNDAGRSSDSPLPLHALRMIDTRAELAIDAVILDAHRLQNVNAKLRIKDGVVTQTLTASVHGGSISADSTFNARYNLARLETQGSVEGLDVGQAVAAMDTGMQARGLANLGWTLSGEGRSGEELGNSLAGPISFTTDDITLLGIGMEHMLCKGVALVNQEALSAEFPTDTRFEALSADIQLADGVATLNPLTSTLSAVALNGTGRLEIDSQDLRASFRAKLSEGLGEIDPACRVNERLSALRWPVECKGNLAGDPASWCSVSTAEIVRDLAEDELKRKAGQEAGRLFNKLLGRD